MQNKKITLYGRKVNLSELYDDCAKKSKVTAVRGFVDAITAAIVADYVPIKKYITNTDSEQHFEKLNQTFGSKCKAVTTDELFKRDTERLCQSVKLLLKRRQNAKEIILEAVVAAVVEILRVAPCVLDSTDSPASMFRDVSDAFGFDVEQTIFDPLPALIRKINGDEFKAQFEAAAPNAEKLYGNLLNAKIRMKRFLEAVNGDSRKTTVSVTDFIKCNHFAEASVLHNLQAKPGEVESERCELVRQSMAAV